MYFVFDLDGVLRNNIEDKLNKFLRGYNRSETLLRSIENNINGLYRESLLLIPNLLPAKFSSKINSKTEKNKMDLEIDMLNLMKALQNSGDSLLIRTVNNGNIAKSLKETLKNANINAKVEQIKNLDKWVPINNEPPIIIEDNPFIALKAAKHNCIVFLLRRNYNSLLGELFSSLNNNIHLVSNANEIFKEINAIKNKTNYSTNK
ncbi:MAG: hypothetical protein ACP5UN_03175 [Candidatus Micrarchaeia archaeon]